MIFRWKLRKLNESHQPFIWLHLLIFSKKWMRESDLCIVPNNGFIFDMGSLTEIRNHFIPKPSFVRIYESFTIVSRFRWTEMNVPWDARGDGTATWWWMRRHWFKDFLCTQFSTGIRFHLGNSTEMNPVAKSADRPTNVEPNRIDEKTFLINDAKFSDITKTKSDSRQFYLAFDLGTHCTSRLIEIGESGTRGTTFNSNAHRMDIWHSVGYWWKVRYWIHSEILSQAISHKFKASLLCHPAVISVLDPLWMVKWLATGVSFSEFRRRQRTDAFLIDILSKLGPPGAVATRTDWNRENVFWWFEWMILCTHGFQHLNFFWVSERSRSDFTIFCQNMQKPVSGISSTRTKRIHNIRRQHIEMIIQEIKRSISLLNDLNVWSFDLLLGQKC
jgi:hypothetical protein